MGRHELREHSGVVFDPVLGHPCVLRAQFDHYRITLQSIRNYARSASAAKRI
jgi:hypothetical protein